jgi:protease II
MMAIGNKKKLTEGSSYWTVFDNRELRGNEYNRPLVEPWQGRIWHDPIREGRVLLIDQSDESHTLSIPHANSTAYLLFDTEDDAKAEWVRLETIELKGMKRVYESRLLRLQERVAGVK